jgi:hypothetical protein
MQLTVADFKECRITTEGLISIIDAIKYFRECSPAYAKRLWQEQSQGTKLCTLGIPVEFHQFSSRGGHKSPVTAFNDLLRILALIPGPQGDALRKAQAELAARSISGDHDLEAALPVRRQEMGSAGQVLTMTGISSTVPIVRSFPPINFENQMESIEVKLPIKTTCSSLYEIILNHRYPIELLVLSVRNPPIGSKTEKLMLVSAYSETITSWCDTAMRSTQNRSTKRA